MSNRKALFLFIFLLGLLIAGAVVGRRGRHAVSPISSSYSAAPRGLKALYLYLKGSGLAVERYLQNFEQLPNGRGNLMVISEPSRVKVTDREAQDLLTWVHRGNFLIVASRCAEGILRPDLDGAILSAVGIKCESNETWQQELSPKRMDVSPSELSLNSKVRQVSAKTVSTPAVTSREGAALLQSGTSPLAFYIQKGAGAVTFVATSSMLENSEIGRKENLQFLSNFIAYNHITSVYFDEFHHGFQQTFSVASRLRLRALSYTAAIMIALIVLFAIAGGDRLGPPVQPLMRRGRSATETIESLSLLFLRGRKHAFLGRSLQQNLLSTLSKKYQLTSDLSNWSQFLEAHRGRTGSGEELKELLVLEFPSRVTSHFLQQYAAGVDHWRKRLKL